MKTIGIIISVFLLFIYNIIDMYLVSRKRKKYEKKEKIPVINLTLETKTVEGGEQIDLSEHTWLEYCKSCDRKHRVYSQPCPTCGVNYTPQPASDKVYDKCMANYQCDGCQAYEEHYH
jgi:hypothetical protein